tara:strand:- start:1093 stop:1323 length:231 start_codon:yes stop_codon:yes gene_type:complete
MLGVDGGGDDDGDDDDGNGNAWVDGGDDGDTWVDDDAIVVILIRRLENLQLLETFGVSNWRVNNIYLTNLHERYIL